MRRRPLFVTALVLLAASATLVAPDRACTASAQEGSSAPGAWVHPREIKAGGRKTLLHEPEVVAYDDEAKAISLRFPLEVTDSLGKQHFGAAQVSGTAHLDLSSGLFRVDALATDTLAAAVPSLEKATEFTAALPESWPAQHTLRLELITMRPGATVDAPDLKLKLTPPELHVRRRPAVLVQIDGEPVFQGVGDLPIETVVNTASDLFRTVKGDRWYLLLDGLWLSAASLAGPWKVEDKLPIAMTQFPVAHARGHIRRHIPGTRRFAKHHPDGAPTPPDPLPEIIVTEKPAELVRLLGDPLFTLVPKVKLQVVANTESDLFFHPKTGKYFLLLSGRWFTADEVDGPWIAAFGALPPEFAKIPADHARSHVLSCVPGTPEANEAAVRASLRERAVVQKRVRADVRLEGKEAETAPIEGSTARLVTNSEDDVVAVGGGYYAWSDGMWFVADDRMKFGPAETLPEGLLPLPESCGLLHVNTTRPLGPAEDGIATETTAASQGVFLHNGAPVYGGGFRRRGFMRNENWYPCARAFGENRWYDPLTGAFQPRSVKYQDDGIPRAALYSPYTAGYGRVIGYASRYRQGGRRVLQYDTTEDEFDTTAGRPDVLLAFQRNDNLVTLDGIPAKELPLGSRAGEPAIVGPAVAVSADGHAFRLTEGKIETFTDGKWTRATEVPKETETWVRVLDRIEKRPAEIATWIKKRLAPLPVNPEVTGP